MKNVVITGSTRGLGFAMALEFLKQGCCVSLCGSSEEHLNTAQEKLQAYKDRTLFIQCDVTCQNELQALWDASQKQWSKIDLWINNAGVNQPHQYVWEVSPHRLNTTMQTNIIGMMYGSQIAAIGMLKQKNGGAIYNMEGLGSDQRIIPKTVLYGTTKAALAYFSKGMARELQGTQVRMGRLSPGMMLTEFITGSKNEESEAVQDPSFRRIFNLLADRPETVAAYLVNRMLHETRNNAHLVWLTTGKATLRFLSAPFLKRKLLP